MQTLALLILNAACDDWENLASIRDSVESSPQGTPVESSELEANLLRLVQNGLLDAHEFSNGTFVRLDPDAVAPSTIPRLWFFISPSGLRLLDASEDFSLPPPQLDPPTRKLGGAVDRTGGMG